MDVGIPPFQETSIYSIKEGFALPGLTTREQSKKMQGSWFWAPQDPNEFGFHRLLSFDVIVESLIYCIPRPSHKVLPTISTKGSVYLLWSKPQTAQISEP